MSFLGDISGLLQIVLIDLTLAGENALAVGMAVTALPKKQRRKAMAVGIVGATVLRIVMACFAVQLLKVTGLLLAGGLLLLWVGWKMACEVRRLRLIDHTEEVPEEHTTRSQKFSQAVWQIVVADVSMSLDNVLAVAGVARDHIVQLAIGLALAVALMAFASSFVARITERYPKAGYVGVVIVLYTALRMVYDGAMDLEPSILALL